MKGSNQDSIANAVAHAVRVWQRSGSVYVSSTGHGEPEAAAVFAALAERGDEYESNLLPLLGHPIPLVAAYALLTLQKMGSRQIAALPSALLERREPLRVVRGCFVNTAELGAFAREIADSLWHDVPAAFRANWNAIFPFVA